MGRAQQAAAASGQSQAGSEIGKLGRRAAEQTAPGAKEGLIPAKRVLEGAGRPVWVLVIIHSCSCCPVQGGCFCGTASPHAQHERSQLTGSWFHTSSSKSSYAQQMPRTASCTLAASCKVPHSLGTVGDAMYGYYSWYQSHTCHDPPARRQRCCPAARDPCAGRQAEGVQEPASGAGSACASLRGGGRPQPGCS